MSSDPTPITYKDAGVDIDAGEALVERIAPAAKATRRPGADADLGGFGGLFDLKAAGYTDPVLVASTDGVGTKLNIAIDTGHYDGLGQDLVAMCVNDIICCGAEPLFFLDYLAMGKNIPERTEKIVEGIADGFVPLIYQRHREIVSHVVSVHSDDAVAEMRRLAREHGLLVGPSSGANMVAARQLLDRIPELETVVTICCDEGEKYLSEYFIPAVHPIDYPSANHVVADL